MNSQYKMFLNFLHNELKITKEDIQAWTKEAIQEEVEKAIGGLHLEHILTQAINRRLKDEHFSLMAAIGKELTKHITLKVNDVRD